MRLILLSLALAVWPLQAEEKVASQPEILDTSDAIPSPFTKPNPEKPAATLPEKQAFENPVKKTAGPITLQNNAFGSLTLGGTFQMLAFYHNLTATSDTLRQLSFSLSEFRIDLNGVCNKHFGVLGQFLLEANGRELGIENAYAYFKNGTYQIQAGKLKKPFSMEALQSDDSLYTVDRGELYQNFLSNTNGYSLYDVGILLQGGFVDEGTAVTYQAGVFNGKQSVDATEGYSGGQYQTVDDGLTAKDFAGRVAFKNVAGLEAELALSVKTAESHPAPNTLAFAANAAYEAGLAYERWGWRLQGELAWGRNHQGTDSLIVSGSSEFLAFYTMLVRKVIYSHGRSSETVLKFEGLDPDVDKPNDGMLRYTVGANYFFTPRISLLANYGILQPVTLVPGEDGLTQDFDILWRLNF